jgi:WD40 repeat protein
MRLKTIQILWHDRNPIFSVDFDPFDSNRLATGGADSHIRVSASLPRFGTWKRTSRSSLGLLFRDMPRALIVCAGVLRASIWLQEAMVIEFNPDGI